MKMNLSYVMVAAVLAGAYACGGSSNNASSTAGGEDAGTTLTDAAPEAAPRKDAGPTDAGVSDAAAEAEAGLDHGAASTTYPAFLPSVGQIQNNGGYVMQHPVIVPVTWHSDPNEAMFQQFAASVGGTSWWHATTSEYGVGAATAGAPVSMTTTAPSSMQDSDFQTLIQTNAAANADGGTGAWPAPTQDTIYAFFLDPTTSLNMGPGQDGGPTDACSSGVGGYHGQVTVGSVTTAYAIVPSCTFGPPYTAPQQSTMSMSHELVEAATDPQPYANSPGWTGFDQEHFGFDWLLEFSSELGDACELYQESFYEEKETSPSFDFFVQRTWSNAAGPLGHNPCVPAPADSYFNVAILNLAETTITLPPQLTGGTTAQNIQVKGVHIPVGQSAQVELGFFSDGPTSGPWTLSWHQGSPFNPNKATYLNVTIDQTTGVNGEKAYATVTPTGESKLAAELLWFESTLGTGSTAVKHIMPVVISSYVSD